MKDEKKVEETEEEAKDKKEEGVEEEEEMKTVLLKIKETKKCNQMKVEGSRKVEKRTNVIDERHNCHKKKRKKIKDIPYIVVNRRKREKNKTERK